MKYIVAVLMILATISCVNKFSYKESSEYSLYKEFVYERDFEKKKALLEKITDDKILEKIVISNANFKLYPKYFSDIACLRIKDLDISVNLLKKFAPMISSNEVYYYCLLFFEKINDDEIIKKIFMYDYTNLKPNRNLSKEHPILRKLFNFEHGNQFIKYDETIKKVCLRKIENKIILEECLKKYPYRISKESLSKELPKVEIKYELHPGNVKKFKREWDHLLDDDSFNLDLFHIQLGKPIGVVPDWNDKWLEEFAESLRNDSTIMDVKNYNFDNLRNNEDKVKREKIDILQKITNKENIFIRRTMPGMEGGMYYFYLITYNQKSYILMDELNVTFSSPNVRLTPIEILNISMFDKSVSIYEKGNMVKISNFNDKLKNRIVVKYYLPWEKKIAFFSLE